MRTPTVSVCIPAYRGAAYIGATVESVLAQTFGDFELVVIDDHSRDGTSALLARFRDPRLRVIENERNLGPQANWNLCLQMARGRYFKLLPQDDLLAPDCLARQIAVFEADTANALSLVFCARRIIDGRGRRLLRRGYPSRRAGRLAARHVLRRCIRRGTNLVGEPGAVLLRTALARKVGDFDASLPYVIDLDYWFRVLLHGDAYYLPENLASFRISRGSWSVALARRQNREFREFIGRVAGRQAFGVRARDVAMGSLMAPLNAALRTALYSAVLD